MPRKLVLLLLALSFAVAIDFVALSPAVSRASTEDGVVEILVFTKADCGTCDYFNKKQLPEAKEKYGEKIKVRSLDVGEGANIQKMVNIESEYGDTAMFLPQVYIGGVAMIGEEAVRKRLDETIDSFLAKGGSDMPVIPREDETAPPPPPAAKPIYVTYFYKKGCKNCDPVSDQLNYIKKFNSQVVLREYDLMSSRGLEMNEAMSAFAAVPEEDRGIAPSVFVGYEYLARDKLSGKALEEAIKKVGTEGTPYPWDSIEQQARQGRIGVRSRFNSFTVLTVVGAGLIDGVNPCAFTVLIFLISYLAFIDRRGRELFMTGGAFSAAVFVTYLLIGLGFLSFVRVLGSAGKWFTLAVAIITAIFGLVSLRDYIAGRRKGKATSTLGLPDNITRRIHKLIRDKVKARYLVLGAVALGAIIAVMELGCTGQVYLPTIAFIARSGGDKFKAWIYLLIYNLMFIIPLLVVFGLFYAGTSSEKLVEWARKHTQTLKLLSAILFFALAALLFATF